MNAQHCDVSAAIAGNLVSSVNFHRGALKAEG
jgi:hypothetical protein